MDETTGEGIQVSDDKVETGIDDHTQRDLDEELDAIDLSLLDEVSDPGDFDDMEYDDEALVDMDSIVEVDDSEEPDDE